MKKKWLLVCALSLLEMGCENLKDSLLSARDLNEELGPIGEQALTNAPPADDGKGIDVGDGGLAVCTTKRWGESELKELSEMALLDNNDAIFPGALLSGNGLENGTFTPIGIPRGAGTISVEGLNFQAGAQYARTLPEISGSTVNQAMQEILSDSVTVGTSANIDTKIEQVFDFDHLMFKVGLSAKFPFGKLKGNFKIERTEARNYYLMRYRQVFYTMTYQTPETPFSVFRDGENFTDPAHQISKNDPVLYVSSASYGRSFFFLVKSRFSMEDVEASLKAAFGAKAGNTDKENEEENKGNGVAINSKFKHSKILNESEITYVALGGNAAAASGILKANGGTEMFNALRKMVADPATSVYTRDNPGRLLSYNLRYLKNNKMARMSFSTVYDKKDCKFTYPGDGKRIEFKFYDIDDYVNIFVNSETGDPATSVSGKNPLPKLMNSFLPPGQNNVKIALMDTCGPVSTMKMRIEVDGVQQPVGRNGELERMVSGSARREGQCGPAYESASWQYKINKNATDVKDVIKFVN